MKIHILTGHFYPQLHPRAFRANELALEFARRGHDVTVTNCWRIDGFDYDAYAKEQCIKVKNLDILHSGMNNLVGSAKQPSYRKGLLNTWKNYLLAGSFFYRGPLIGKKLVIDDDTDLVIALATPFTCLYGLSYYARKNGKKWVAIGDSGDPFYGSRQTPKAIWFKYIERRAYKQFDFLTIPTENAIPLYAPMIKKEKIKIIPQGFRMDNLKLYEGERSLPVKFAYAGVFYWDIRNPEFLFKYLEGLKDVSFEFNVYMRGVDARLETVLEKYPTVKSMMNIRYSLPHDELLYELSKMHFLINIENLSNTQMPSKLIDYGMTGRPILSCNETNFKPEVLDAFINRNYEGAYQIDIKKYDIRHIADQFMDLYKISAK